VKCECSITLGLFLDVGLQRIIEKQNKVVITDRMWARLLSSTNQPSFMSDKDVIEDKTECISGEKKEEDPATQFLDNGNRADGVLENKEVSSV
jgi:6-phosphofructokinase 1